MSLLKIGSKCFGLITTSIDPEFLLPVELVILEKYSLGNRNNYKVKIVDIFENDFNYLKEHMSNLRLSSTLKDNTSSKAFIKKSEVEKIESKLELISLLNDRPFFLEDNYITTNKDGLKDLYIKFTKYLINYHYSRLFQLMKRNFLASTPFFENQKDMFLKRVNKIGFEDIFKRFELDLDID